jgi:hypothetical protein
VSCAQLLRPEDTTLLITDRAGAAPLEDEAPGVPVLTTPFTPAELVEGTGRRLKEAGRRPVIAVGVNVGAPRVLDQSCRADRAAPLRVPMEAAANPAAVVSPVSNFIDGRSLPIGKSDGEIGTHGNTVHQHRLPCGTAFDVMRSRPCVWTRLRGRPTISAAHCGQRDLRALTTSVAAGVHAVWATVTRGSQFDLELSFICNLCCRDEQSERFR